MQNEIKELASSYRKKYEVIHAGVPKEFRESFFPCASLNSNDSIMLHTLSLQQHDSSIDKSICTYPVGCGHKSKKSMLLETSCIEITNDIENPSQAMKFYSKTNEKHKKVVLK